MGEIKKGRHKMKLFNWLRGLFREPRPDHGDPNDWLWFNPAEWEMKVETERRISSLSTEIARLRRNKKKHSHLQKELDALINKGADTQTNNGDDQ